MKAHVITEIQPFQTPAQEVAKFLMGFALNFEERERYELDKEKFLQESTLSNEAQEILKEPNANAFLGKLNATEMTAFLAVIIIETVTTEVVVL